MILVTGGAGYIGSIMVDKLIKKGQTVLVLDNLSTGSKKLIHPKANFILADLLDFKKIESILRNNKIETIFHFAAKISVEESVQKPDLYFETNYKSSENLFQLAIKNCDNLKNIIFSSTAAIYGLPNTLPVKEDFVATPINPYGQSKLMAENSLINLTKRSNIKVGILRYFNVAGATTDLKYGQLSVDSGHLLKRLAQVTTGSRPHIDVYGVDYPTKDGSGERDYIHVEDLVDIHYEVLNYLINTDNQLSVFNCGYGHSYSVFDMIKAMETVSGKKIAYQIKPKRIGDPPSIYADCTKLNNSIKWNPKFDNIHQICESVFNWEKALNKK